MPTLLKILVPVEFLFSLQHGWLHSKCSLLHFFLNTILVWALVDQFCQSTTSLMVWSAEYELSSLQIKGLLLRLEYLSAKNRGRESIMVGGMVHGKVSHGQRQWARLGWGTWVRGELTAKPYDWEGISLRLWVKWFKWGLQIRNLIQV